MPLAGTASNAPAGRWAMSLTSPAPGTEHRASLANDATNTRSGKVVGGKSRTSPTPLTARSDPGSATQLSDLARRSPAGSRSRNVRSATGPVSSRPRCHKTCPSVPFTSTLIRPAPLARTTTPRQAGWNGSRTGAGYARAKSRAASGSRASPARLCHMPPQAPSRRSARTHPPSSQIRRSPPGPTGPKSVAKWVNVDS
jgi:hypothetical protein